MPLPHSLSRQATRLGVVTLLACAAALPGHGQSPPPSTALKDQIRDPWVRSHERFIRGPWQISSEIPLAAGSDALAKDPFDGGGEAVLKPGDASSSKLADGTALSWRPVTAWGDAIDLSNGNGLKRDLVAYAATTITRAGSGKVRLCLGSDEGMRAWVNGVLVLNHPGPRPLTFDEDQVEVDLQAGDNLLVVKVEQRTGAWGFAARVLESGALPPRVQEIAPSLTVQPSGALDVITDLNSDGATGSKVEVQLVAAGGKILGGMEVDRGSHVTFDPTPLPDGPYEIRCTTRKPDGLRYSTHLAWYKGDAIAAARQLVAAAAKADVSTPAGQTIKMLGDLVLDRLGKEGLAITGNPWWAIHSPLMEYAELQLEAAGNQSARARDNGFYRLAWRDEVDGSPQYARAYLPIGYDPAKKTPLVVKLHGYNPPNPEYIRWWGVDSRHGLSDVEYGAGEGLIYLEPHGRGNTQYLGFGDADILRAIAEAKARFNVDEDRVYLCGDSMGGWGTWNVGTRHPDVFAALAPIYGGVDYHMTLTEEQLAALNPLTRFLYEKDSTQALADGLINLPVLVLHGDRDPAVNVDWSRYNVRMLQRWGYDVRYVELPGYAHEDINRWPLIFDWFLQHRRNASPRHVRLRSAELQNAAAYWVTVDAPDRPDDFMLVDAEVVAPNTIRLDTRNIVALTLTPGAKLIDPAKPLTVVWNGQTLAPVAKNGKFAVQAPRYAPVTGAKNSRIAGPLGDIFNTPFAIVTGTASTDPAMNEVCRQKSDALVALWKEWQRQPPRVFNDSELSDGDAAKYSLILIGGPDANLITRKLADRLPLKLTGEGITVGTRAFVATDARVQLIRPNPLNPDRYVFVAGATSAAGMRFWSPGTVRGAQFDFTIEDGHVATSQKENRSDLWVAGGWFGRNWEAADALVHPGSDEARAKSVTLRGPLEPGVLDAYVGRYQLAPGVVAEVTRSGRVLSSRVGGDAAVELIPAGQDIFFIFEGSVVVVFTKDAAGKIISFNATRADRQFSGKRLD